MKINSLMIAAVLLSSSYALAASSTESFSSRGPSFGIQGGLDFQSAQTPKQISSDTYTGFSVGVNFELPLSSTFSIQPELNYVRRGLNLVDAGGVKANVYYHSLELPVFAKLGFGESIRPFVFAGPMAIANISHEVQGVIGGTSASTSFDPKTIDLAGVVGVGLQLGTFFVNARYSVGLLNINSHSGDWYSRGFRLMAGLQL